LKLDWRGKWKEQLVALQWSYLELALVSSPKNLTKITTATAFPVVTMLRKAQLGA